MKTADEQELLQFSTDIVEFIKKMKKCTDRSYNGYFIERYYDPAGRCKSTGFIDQNDINKTVLEYGAGGADCNYITILNNEILRIGYYHRCKNIEIIHLHESIKDVYGNLSSYYYIDQQEYFMIPDYEMTEEQWFQLSLVNEYSAVIQMFYNINALNKGSRKCVSFDYDAREHNKLITRKVQCITLP